MGQEGVKRRRGRRGGCSVRGGGLGGLERVGQEVKRRRGRRGGCSVRGGGRGRVGQEGVCVAVSIALPVAVCVCGRVYCAACSCVCGCVYSWCL